MQTTNSSRLVSIGARAIAVVLAIAWLPSAAPAQQLRSDEEAARIVALEQVAVRDGVVAGAVRNKAGHELREVQIFVRYTWLWDDERNPGKIDPGTSTYYTLKDTIKSGDKLDFTYKPSPPLPKIAGGKFVTTVKVAGFTEVIPRK